MDRGTPTMVRRGLAMVAAIFFVSGCASTTPAPATFGATPTVTELQACQRNGGYWVTASGYCKIGA